MKLALFIYLAGIVGNIGAVLTTTSIFGCIALVVYLIVVGWQIDANNGEFKDYKGGLRNSAIAVFLFAILSSAIPSEKTMYMMLAGYAGQQALQSETAAKVQKLIDVKLDEFTNEIINKKKEK